MPEPLHRTWPKCRSDVRVAAPPPPPRARLETAGLVLLVLAASALIGLALAMLVTGAA